MGDILRKYLCKYGKQWDGRESLKIVGQTPLEAATTIVEDYGLPCKVDEFNSEFYPLFSAQYVTIKILSFVPFFNLHVVDYLWFL